MASQSVKSPQDVAVEAAGASLEGFLTIPENPEGIVLFAHGSGSSRHSLRNRFVAEELNEVSLATLLFDLLTPDEHHIDERNRELRFDIPLLATRLTGAVDWVTSTQETQGLPIGLFGASTGAAAALVSAAERPELVKAVVSRGGRPDLAGEALARVWAPTLLIVGGFDTPVIRMNEEASDRMSCPCRLEIVLEASHLFEEPGKLDEVARLAQRWFSGQLGGGQS